MNKSSIARSLDNAVCVCGHWFDDHKVSDYNHSSGRITLGECLDTICICSTYRRDVLIGQLP